MAVRIPSASPSSADGPDTSGAALGQVTVDSVCVPAEGWMAGGFGKYNFTFRNGTEFPARATGWRAYWEVEGIPYGEEWGGDLDIEVPIGGETVTSEISRLPVDVIEESSPGIPVMAGAFTFHCNGTHMQVPFRLEVPEARLPEDTQLFCGRHVGLEMMPSHISKLSGKDAVMQWLDRVYDAMHELTGYTPIDGNLVIIKECPEHPWFAYVDGAGLPIFMNTKRIDSVFDDIERGIAPSGWVHEIGHFFDVCGKWYFWGSASVEWQANWKLCYAYETIPDRSFKAVFSPNKNLAYWPEHEVVLDARQWVDAYFLFTGDPYLADPARKWDTLSSDELHSFFQRLVRVYGWEPFKRWYRTYDRFEKLGLTEPKTPEGTIQLIAAILCKETDSDLVPVFQRWRMPVTREDVEAMNNKYPIKETRGWEVKSEARRCIRRSA